MNKEFFYAVRIGRAPGIYTSWTECLSQVHQYPGAVFRKFKKREAAEAFLTGKHGASAAFPDTHRAAPARIGSRGSSGTFPATSQAAEADSSDGASAAPVPAAFVENLREAVYSLFLSQGKEVPAELLKLLSDAEALEASFSEALRLSGGSAFSFTDGSYHSGTQTFGYGTLLIRTDGSVRADMSCGRDPSLAEMRNVSGEIYGSMQAVWEALRQKLPDLTIFYDYLGIECWANHSWKTNKEGTRHYADFIDKARKEIKIFFVKVPAHSGVFFNEIVDRLAKAAAGNL